MARPWDNAVRRYREFRTGRPPLRRVNTLTAPGAVGIDLVSAPPYEMSDALRDSVRAEVEDLVERLLPNAVDAYSGDVLHRWADTRAGQIVAQLDAERDERMAIGEALIGLAKEEAARRQGKFLAAQIRLREAEAAMELTWTRIAGERRLPSTASATPVIPSLSSPLGRTDLTVDWEPPPDQPSSTNGYVDPLPNGTKPHSGANGAVQNNSTLTDNHHREEEQDSEDGRTPDARPTHPSD